MGCFALIWLMGGLQGGKANWFGLECSFLSHVFSTSFLQILAVCERDEMSD